MDEDLQTEVAMDDQTEYKRAKMRVGAIRGFYQHLQTYVLVNSFLFVLNLLTSPGDWWFYWPLLGWGIGLVSHAVSVYGMAVFGGKTGKSERSSGSWRRTGAGVTVDAH